MQSFADVDSRWIAVSIAVVVRRTTRRNLGSLWRLSKLPYLGKRNASVCGTRHPFGKSAPRRRRTGIIRDPVNDFSGTRVLTNIVRSHDIFAAFFCRGNTGAVDPGNKAACGYSVDPRVDVGFLLGQHPSTLFLIKENDGPSGKSFASRRDHSSPRIRLA